MKGLIRDRTDSHTPLTVSKTFSSHSKETLCKLYQVYGDKDEDGFYWGELDGRAGFIPYNMVSEVRLDGDESSISSEVISPSPNLNQDSTQSLNQSLQSEVSGTDPDDATGDMTLEDDEFEDPRYSANYQLPPRRMVAQFDYDPQTLSPNPDSEVRETCLSCVSVLYVAT